MSRGRMTQCGQRHVIMTYGAPVVATTADPLPEVLGDAALLVPSGDTPAMERILSDDALREALCVHGYSVAAAYLWKRCAPCAMGIYETVVML